MLEGRKRTPMPIPEREALSRGAGDVITYTLSSEELEEYKRTGKLIREEETMSTLTKEQYLQLRLEGKGRTEIMKGHFRQQPKLFYDQLREWGIKEKDAEDRELELLPKPEPEVIEKEPAITLDVPETQEPEAPRVDAKHISNLATRLEELLLDHNITAKIKRWAIDRNLHTADPAKQMLKLGEEYGELCQGMAKGNQAQIVDSIGDIYVVLTVLSLQLGLDIETCIDQAYEEIKDRKGKMINGVFVKESDITA